MNANQTIIAASMAAAGGIRQGTGPLAATMRPEDLQWGQGVENERTAIHVRGRDVDNAFSILESIAGPGAATPLHYHREAETFFVIEGVMTYDVGGRIFEAGPGTSAFVPGGIPHRWTNRSGSATRVIAFFSPGGVEEMFLQLNGKSIDEIIAVAATFGVVVVGPPMA